MKRVWAILSATVLCIGLLPCVVSAQTAAVYVTDAVYASVITGGADGNMVYTAYGANDTLVIGTLSAEGELTREDYSRERYDALVADEEWVWTVHGDAGSLCPYASSHTASTVCPYTQVVCADLTNTVSGVVIERAYVASRTPVMLPSGTVRFCLGRIGYQSPETLRFAEGERYMAKKADNGRWGVFDSERGILLVAPMYRDMSAVYGEYVKVYNGEAWGRLHIHSDLSVTYEYQNETDFSITEEVRAIGNNQWQVFSKDNEPISPILTGAYSSVTYAPKADMVLAIASDGTKALIDLNGETAATFTKQQQVSYLQDNCFAVGNVNAIGGISGIALLRVDGAPTPAMARVKGDVNGDGVSDTADARLILLSQIGGAALTDLQRETADVSGNGAVETADAREILMMCLK